MEAYWPMISPKPPPTGNFRLSSTLMQDNDKQNKQNIQRIDRLYEQQILQQMTQDIIHLCENIDQYRKERQIQLQKDVLKQLKYEEHWKKEQLEYKE